MTLEERNYDMENKIREQVQSINEVVLSFANFDFTKRAAIYGEDDVMDSLAAGINMLGEELQSSTISLKEKEILLKEVHHRVKNNLQIISSILSLQAQFSKSISEKKALEDCQNRIMSMALVHEKLYQAEDLERIELNSYIASIVDNLGSGMGDDKVKIDFERSTENHFAHIDPLIPIGLIINELITNSIEHAFDDNGGTVHIVLTKPNGLFELRVSDNGKGFDPTSNDFRGSLGIQLIDALVDQIEADFAYEIDNGTSALLRFDLLK